MNKFNQVKEKIFARLMEERIPGVEYQMLDKKGKPVQVIEQCEKVVAVLKEQKASAATKLMEDFIKIQTITKSLEKLNAEFLSEVGTMFEETFSPEDIVYSRAIQTASLVMTFTKEGKKETIDYKKFIEEVKTILTPELVEKLNEIRKKYTTVKKIDPRYHSMKFSSEESKQRVKSKMGKFAMEFDATKADEGGDKEELQESMVYGFMKIRQNFMKMMHKLVNSVMVWSHKFDYRLKMIETRFDK